MADQAVARQPQRLGQRDHVIGLRIQAVVQVIARLRQAAPTYVQHIGIEDPAEAFADKAPGHRRTGNAGNDNDGSPRATITRRPIAQ